MPQPFPTPSEIRTGMFARLRADRPEMACLQAIEELFAAARRVRDVRPEQVRELSASHGVDIARELRPARWKLYRCFLEHCLLDHALSEEERRDLAHLRGVLHLSDVEAARLHDHVARDVYGAAVGSALQDLQVDPQEEAFLERLRADLDLPEPAAEELRETGRVRATARFIEEHVVYEDALSPDRRGSLHVEGASDGSLEDAFRRASDAAARAVPDLERAELIGVYAEIEDGGVAYWRVKVRARLPSSD